LDGIAVPLGGSTYRRAYLGYDGCNERSTERFANALHDILLYDGNHIDVASEQAGGSGHLAAGLTNGEIAA
jgi:hypothetical protein